MKIIKTLSTECPVGSDCDAVYDIDDVDDVLVRARFLTADDTAGLGVLLPAHEGLLRIKRSVLKAATQ